MSDNFYVIDIDGVLHPACGDEVRVFRLTGDEYGSVHPDAWPLPEEGRGWTDIVDKIIAEDRVWGFIPSQVFDQD